MWSCLDLQKPTKTYFRLLEPLFFYLNLQNLLLCSLVSYLNFSKITHNSLLEMLECCKILLFINLISIAINSLIVLFQKVHPVVC